MRPPIVLLHGAWCWTPVLIRLAAIPRTAVAVDMAGHGLYAPPPRSLYRRPFDPEALATEPSPVVGVDLDQAADLLLSQLELLGRGEPVTVVAHSMGGVVLTRAAQQAPDLVAHAVYLAAFMPASDLSAGAYAMMPEYEGALLFSCVRNDALATGAARLDTTSPDPDYRRQLREAFYGDVDEPTAEAAIALLGSDVPIGIGMGVTTLTADGWGRVPRTYVTCTRDRALPPPVQQKFIRDADTTFPDNPTAVVTLDASHSPFLSMPAAVADIIGKL